MKYFSIRNYHDRIETIEELDGGVLWIEISFKKKITGSQVDDTLTDISYEYFGEKYKRLTIHMEDSDDDDDFDDFRDPPHVFDIGEEVHMFDEDDNIPTLKKIRVSLD